MAGQRYQQFMAAKQALRTHPDWTDEQVAKAIDVKLFDAAGMEAVKQARRDLAAGDSTRPDTRPRAES